MFPKERGLDRTGSRSVISRDGLALPEDLPVGITKRAGLEPLPGYRLLEPLGSGSFGEVWKCEAPGGIYKAVKFVYDNSDPLGRSTTPTEQELQSLQHIKDIRHPFLLSLDRVEFVQGELLIVMELADQSLHDRLLECRRQGLTGIPRQELLQYLCEAAEVLDMMNLQRGLQHLDIKPRNLFLISKHLKVGDFGLVQSLQALNGQTGTSVPCQITPLYASPETFRGEPSRNSDQYSLAITYCELLSGKLPFPGKNLRQLLLQHSQHVPDLSALPESDRPVLLRALAKDPNQRHPSCLDFLQALVLASTAVTTQPTKLTSSQLVRTVRGLADTQINTAATTPLAAVELAKPPAPERKSWLGTSASRTRQPAAPTPGWTRAVAELVKLTTGSWQVCESERVRYLLRRGEVLSHQFVTRLPPEVVEYKLEQFVRLCQARLGRREEGTFTFVVEHPDYQPRWGLRAQPQGLTVTVQSKRLEPPSTFTQIATEVRPLGYKWDQADQLLRESAPILLQALREELQSFPERRGGERLPWQPTLQISPVLAGGDTGAPITCRGINLSLSGIGLAMPFEPPTQHLLVQLPSLGDAVPVQVLVQVVRTRAGADGWYEVGTRFLPQLPAATPSN